MIYQHPLAYLLGLEGAALMSAFNGDYDRAFTEARFAEIRALVQDGDQLGEGRETYPITAAEGYAVWAGDYDEPGNRLIDLEQPVVWDILSKLPTGIALDAACGTGRHAESLASTGHRVIGVDASSHMLAVASAKLPGCAFYRGDLHQLPFAGRHVD